MKWLCVSFLLLTSAVQASDEASITGVWFETHIGDSAYTCTTQRINRTDGTQYYGPVLVFPAGLKEQCAVGSRGGWLTTPGKAEKRPDPENPWFVGFRGLKIPAKCGYLYLVRPDPTGGFSLETISFPAPAGPGTPSLKAVVEKTLR